MPSRKTELQKVRDLFAAADNEKAAIWLEVLMIDLKVRGVIGKKERKPTKAKAPAVGQQLGTVQPAGQVITRM